MYGMISGSPTADVVTTGSVTIPVMKRLGYKPAVAAAIEVAASTGGSIMPPVMGSAAFIMAEYTGIEYRDIAIAALLPALLYYVCVYSQVHFRAIRLGLGALDASQIPTLLATLQQGRPVLRSADRAGLARCSTATRRPWWRSTAPSR